MSSRDAILSRVRAAIGSSAPPSAVPREYLSCGSRSVEENIDLLIDRLEDYKASVSVVPRDDLAAAMAAELAGMSSVVIPLGLAHEIAAACADSARRVVVDGHPDLLSPNDLDLIDIVVTQASVAIAVTGTIILDGGRGQGRRVVSLVPDRHLVVLLADQIVETVPEAVRRLDADGKATAPLTLISGPSATSDIELERVEGVHGPRTLRVIIVS